LRLSRLADAASLSLLAFSWSVGLWFHRTLPEVVPIHWGLDGQPNGWGPRWVNSIGFPAVATLVYLTLIVLPRRDARKRHDDRILPVFAFYRLVVVLFLVVIHGALLAISTGHPVDVTLLIRIVLPLLLLGIGAGFTRLPPNSYGGFRFPWTLASEEAWTKTHRFAGRLWIWGSLVALAAAALPLLPGAAVLVATILILAFVPLVYALRLRNT